MRLTQFIIHLIALEGECGDVEVVIDDGMTDHLSVIERAESAICTHNGGERRIVVSIVRKNEQAGLKVKGFGEAGQG